MCDTVSQHPLHRNTRDLFKKNLFFQTLVRIDSSNQEKHREVNETHHFNHNWFTCWIMACLSPLANCVQPLTLKLLRNHWFSCIEKRKNQMMLLINRCQVKLGTKNRIEPEREVAINWRWGSSASWCRKDWFFEFLYFGLFIGMQGPAQPHAALDCRQEPHFHVISLKNDCQ